VAVCGIRPVLSDASSAAGIMACPQGKTQDVFESQFGCNHLAHFLLFALLKPLLLASATPDLSARCAVLGS
jgi:hypothetical protein